MKKLVRVILHMITPITLIAAVFSYLLTSIDVLAWGDSDGGRQEYTIEEIEYGALGPVGDDAKNQPGYPGKIVFNSISDSVIGHEFNFVGAREDTGINAGINNRWEGNDITVEDQKTYLIRIYAHNNSPHGWDAVSENTRVWFDIPLGYSSTQIQVNGFISSSNATPSKYWDYVNFNSDIPFHLEYVYGSALLENNGGAGGSILSDDIILSESWEESANDQSKKGVLIGYDTTDGRVPGCYKYSNYITIKVKVVYDYEFITEAKVRLANSENKTWQKIVEAKVGDKVEFQFQYLNTSKYRQNGVAMRDILPESLRYIEGSTILYNSNHPDGLTLCDDTVVKNGVNIGNYEADSNAYIRITAEVVGDNLARGSNALHTWGQTGVGNTTLQDYATVIVYNDEIFRIIIYVLGISMVACFIFMSIILLVKRHRFEQSSTQSMDGKSKK